MAIVAFHGHGDRIGIAPGIPFDPAEEILEPRCRVRDLEGLEQTAVREADGNRVALRANIDTNTQLQRLGSQHGSLLRQSRSSDHPSVSSTYRATIARDRHHPGRPVG